jgi:hypothetical protein
VSLPSGKLEQHWFHFKKDGWEQALNSDPTKRESNRANVVAVNDTWVVASWMHTQVCIWRKNAPTAAPLVLSQSTLPSHYFDVLTQVTAIALDDTVIYLGGKNGWIFRVELDVTDVWLGDSLRSRNMATRWVEKHVQRVERPLLTNDSMPMPVNVMAAGGGRLVAGGEQYLRLWDWNRGYLDHHHATLIVPITSHADKLTVQQQEDWYNTRIMDLPTGFVEGVCIHGNLLAVHTRNATVYLYDMLRHVKEQFVPFNLRQRTCILPTFPNNVYVCNDRLVSMGNNATFTVANLCLHGCTPLAQRSSSSSSSPSPAWVPWKWPVHTGCTALHENVSMGWEPFEEHTGASEQVIKKATKKLGFAKVA